MLKRLLSYFMVFVTLLEVCGVRAEAVKNEYQVNIAVLCEDLEKGQELINKMCREKCVLNPLEMSVDLTGEKNPGKNTTELYVGYNDTNYHVRFHLINGVNHSILKKCSGAIILYDISDSTLDPIVHSGTYMSSDIKRLMSTDTPLVKYIKKLQYSWPGILSFVHGWYNAITFVTYGKEKLDPDVYDSRRERINYFTCEVEAHFGVDNKWGRGHQELSTDKCWQKSLFWISGEARRSISDGSISSKYYTLEEPESLVEDLESEDEAREDAVEMQEVVSKKKFFKRAYTILGVLIVMAVVVPIFIRCLSIKCKGE